MTRKRVITALKRIRMSRCMSQTELAKMLGTVPGAVCYLEKHGIQRISTAVKYAEQLRCRPEELMDFIFVRECEQSTK